MILRNTSVEFENLFSSPILPCKGLVIIDEFNCLPLCLPVGQILCLLFVEWMSKIIERTDSYAYRREADRQACSQGQTDRQKDRKRRLQIGRQTQTERQIDRHRDRQIKPQTSGIPIWRTNYELLFTLFGVVFILRGVS